MLRIVINLKNKLINHENCISRNLPEIRDGLIKRVSTNYFFYLLHNNYLNVSSFFFLNVLFNFIQDIISQLSSYLGRVKTVHDFK